MSSANQFPEKHIAHQDLSVSVTNITAGGNNVELIAAPGAGKRLKVFGVVVDNASTAESDFTVHFSGGKNVLKQTIQTGADPLVVSLTPHFVLGPANEALQADVADQAADDWNVTVYYQVEDI